jgi:GT2 family glycosyltransferase/glycosyltransferase involved in cell wall biosynthesis
MIFVLFNRLKSFLKPFVGSRADASKILSQADALNSERRWDEAASEYRRFLALRSDLAPVWVQLGHCQKELGDMDASEKSYRRAIDVDPNHWDAYIHLADVLKRCSNLAESFNLLAHVAAHSPDEFVYGQLSDLIGTTSRYTDIINVVSKEFDSSYYTLSNPDVVSAGVEPKIHYLLYGWREGRSPCSYFDPGFYVRRFGDRIPVGAIPFVHFCIDGKHAGLRGSQTSDRQWFEPKAPGDDKWGEAIPAPIVPGVRAIVVIPVYGGHDATLDCIYHALNGQGELKYSVLVMNDCSPDPVLNETLQWFAERGLFSYHRNSTNLGFVRNVNLAIRTYCAGSDVVLLNSDAYVYKGWFDRLIGHAQQGSNVATVTALSNNATICSYPQVHENNNRSIELSPSELDRLVAAQLTGASIDAPTGVGFCMLLTRGAIEELGLFDEKAFGKGYGEENDFCMRALASGYRNVIAHDVFVYHVGSVSFAESKYENMRAGAAVLLARYPSYNMRVSMFTKADPGRSLRQAIDVARLQKVLSGGVVFVSHRWGGGIEKYLRGEIVRLREAGVPCVVLRVHDLHFVSVDTEELEDLYVPNLLAIDLRCEFDVIKTLLAGCTLDAIHVNSFAGLDWPSHKRLVELIASSGHFYKYLVHDYSSISFNLNLMVPDGLGASIEDWDDVVFYSRQRCNDFADVCDPRERREVYACFLGRAGSVVAPSRAAANILERFYPGVSVEVVPHREDIGGDLKLARSRLSGADVRVVVIGAISIAKGYLHLLDLAGDARERGLRLRFFLVGHSVNDDDLRSVGVEVTGPYQGDVAAVRELERIQPHLILYPSVCHETFCYTLSLARRINVPPVVFDFGAPAERVKEWGFGYVLSSKERWSAGHLNNTLQKLANSDVSYGIVGSGHEVVA